MREMADLTKHGAKRVKERLNIPKKAAGKNAELAFEKGLRHSECKGDLKRYIARLYFQHGAGSDYRVYNHYVYCFTFKEHKLKTAMALPQGLHKLADKLQAKKEKGEDT